ncbi:AAA-like domain-containing protein [Microcoleus sp. FACHB-672]|uniref:AAA-like domain-containing protein n=1 Tax=Microcoleus sp. FACHB-672 TaxID=2692825 RepID=UPI0016821E54|nr:AAA-like domain-containing protein [Microcoleus sp. FACHB-672]MBD2040487.1 AAA-like domain-containing protein [Microcoleus sp. FACHB-672]
MSKKLSQEEGLSRLEAELKANEDWKKLISDGDFAQWCGRARSTAHRWLKKYEEEKFIKITTPDCAGRDSKKEIIWVGKQEKPVIYPLIGIVPIGDRRYIERAADKTCRQALQADRSKKSAMPFIRIKASQGMGKSSLLVHLRHLLEKQPNHLVGFVDLGGVGFEPEAFTNLDKLLQRFTYAIAQSFKGTLSNYELEDLKKSWRSDVAPGTNCTDYLRDRIFSKIKQSKTLIIDGIDAVLGYEKTQTPFLNLLRTWNETEMKVVSQAQIVWPSIVVAYSTETYLDREIRGSVMPNVGDAVELEEFNSNQILELANKYGLETWTNVEVKTLKALVGGHPALVNLGLYQISQNNLSLEELERKAVQANGPFGSYLLNHLELLQRNQNLRQCFSNILKQETCKDEFAKFQLEKAGLIRQDGFSWEVRFELYKRYFQEHL